MSITGTAAKAAYVHYKMTHVEDIFENVLQDSSDDDNFSDYDEVIDQYFIPEVFKKKHIPMSTIIKWEIQLAKFIVSVNTRGGYASSVDIESLMVDGNLDIIASSIRISKWNDNRPIETAVIASINQLHKSLFKYISKEVIPKGKTFNITTLYTVSSYFYSASIKINTQNTIAFYLRSMDRFYNMVDSGFIDDICNLIKVSKYEIN